MSEYLSYYKILSICASSGFWIPAFSHRNGIIFDRNELSWHTLFVTPTNERIYSTFSIRASGEENILSRFYAYFELRAETYAINSATCSVEKLFTSYIYSYLKIFTISSGSGYFNPAYLQSLGISIFLSAS